MLAGVSTLSVIMNQPSYLVFPCFGEEGFYYECAFALLSLSRLYDIGNLPFHEIWIYTDNAGWFTRFKDCPLPLRFRNVTTAEINEWKGAINYLYRSKIEMLKDFTETHQGNVLFCDTDIVFTSPLAPLLQGIEAGQVYMQNREGIVNTRSSPMLKRLDDYLRRTPHTPVNGKNLFDLPMWNSGIIGFNTSIPDVAADALAFTDEYYPRNHSIRVIEQFAFSVVFLRSGAIHAAAPYTLHYWNLREARQIFQSFFTHLKGSSWQQLTQLSGMIQLFETMMEKVRFENSQNFLGKIIQVKWRPPATNWDELKRQL